MLTLEQIEHDITAALKAKNQLAADTLRALKVRVQNEKTAAGRPERSEGSASSKELSESEIIALVRSEIKRRKEAADSFTKGGRPEMASRELEESKLLEGYLPAQMSEAEIQKIIDATVTEHAFAAPDFGKAMAAVKAAVGNAADGAVIAKLLKAKLK